MMLSTWRGGNGGKNEVPTKRRASWNISGLATTLSFVRSSDLMIPEKLLSSQSLEVGGLMIAS